MVLSFARSGRAPRHRIIARAAAFLVQSGRANAVGPDLASCHTAVVDGLVIEGHVPAEEIVRLLDTRPAGVRGLAVPGMPLGSPGMEQPDGVEEPYDIVAFKTDGERYVFARRPSA
jgi:hypothetical protein